MKNKNTLSKRRFIGNTLLLGVPSAVLYRLACFSGIHGITVVESRMVYWALMIGLTFLGTLITLKKRRNAVSLFVNIALPFEVYTIISTYRYKSEVYTVVLAVAAAVSLVYFIMVMTGKVENKKYWLPIMRNRIKFGLLGVRTIAVVLVMIVTVNVCSDMFFGYGLVSADADTDIADSKYGEWTVENHIESIVLLDNSKWSALSVSEKMNILGIIKNIEMRKFGINHEVYLNASDLEGNVAGSYYNQEHKISLDIEHVKSSPSEEVLRTLLHECMHVYQHMCVDLYDKLDDEYKKMPMFKNTLQYKKNFSNYVSGSEDYDLYYEQTVEASAREYATLIADEYFCYIEEFLMYGDLPER